MLLGDSFFFQRELSYDHDNDKCKNLLEIYLLSVIILLSYKYSHFNLFSN